MMNTVKIAFNNLKKNFGFYALYLVSVTFILSIFFAFVSFSQNTVMMEKISTDGRVETMSQTISVFLMAFVLFYMSYSNKFFLRRRSKELGIYTMLGYRKSKIIILLALENIFVCVASFLLGIVLGALTHKGIVAATTKLLALNISNSEIPFFNTKSIAYSAIFVAAVIIFLIISNTLTVRRITLLELVRYEKKAERKIKIRVLPAIFGTVTLLSGYLLAINITQGKESLWYKIGYSPIALLTALLIGLGTILSIHSFLPWIMATAKKNKRTFFTPEKIITIPGFVYRIRTNAKTLIMLTLLMAATLTATGTIALTLYYPITAVERIIPSEIEFRVADTELDNAMLIINKYTDNATITQTDIISVPATANKLPSEYSLGSQKGTIELEKIARTPCFECISESVYRTLLGAQGRLKEASDLLPIKLDECILVKYTPNLDGNFEKGEIYTLQSTETIPLEVKNTTLLNPIGFTNSIGTLIVTDEVYNKLAASNLPTTHIVSLNGQELKGNNQLFSALSELLQDSPYLVSSSARVEEIIYTNSSTFLLLGFLVFLFFIATGSILFFNNITAVTESKSEFVILRRMGYDRKLIKKIIRNEVFAFFAIPFIIGILHSIFALICYKTMLMQNILGDSLAVYMPVIAAFAGTLIITGIYYVLTIRACNKAGGIIE
jgi:putative ABC transport system permease protein